jgi:peroxiredoxin
VSASSCPAARLAAAAAAALVTLGLAAAPPVAAQPPSSLTTVDGKTIQLAGRAGGITHVVFVARWCGAPCDQDLVAVRELAGRFARQGMRVVLVGTGKRQTQDEFVRWARSAGMGGALVFDADGRLEKSFGVSVLPWHVVVGGDGKVLYSADSVPGEAVVSGWLGGRSGP